MLPPNTQELAMKFGVHLAKKKASVDQGRFPQSVIQGWFPQSFLICKFITSMVQNVKLFGIYNTVHSINTKLGQQDNQNASF